MWMFFAGVVAGRLVDVPRGGGTVGSCPINVAVVPGAFEERRAGIHHQRTQ